MSTTDFWNVCCLTHCPHWSRVQTYHSYSNTRAHTDRSTCKELCTSAQHSCNDTARSCSPLCVCTSRARDTMIWKPRRVYRLHTDCHDLLTNCPSHKSREDKLWPEISARPYTCPPPPTLTPPIHSALRRQAVTYRMSIKFHPNR